VSELLQFDVISQVFSENMSEWKHLLFLHRDPNLHKRKFIKVRLKLRLKIRLKSGIRTRLKGQETTDQANFDFQYAKQ